MHTRTRLWAAAALCLLPLGFVWSGGVTSGYVLFGDCDYTENSYCVPDQYVPGTPYHSLVLQAPIRVFLVAAAVGFLLCATRRRTLLTRRVARVACASTAVAALLAAGNGSPRILVCLVAALALVAPVVTPEGVRPGVLANHRRAG
jgi:hypothetical protein